MKRVEISPQQIADAFAMREVGFTTLAISQRTGISTRTLNRHFADGHVKKGRIKAAAIQQAREALLARVTSDGAIKEEAAKLIADDLAHAQHLRQVIFDASSHMTATNLREAVLVMRAAAAYSTAIKNTSDIVRHSLRPERFDTEIPTELPELIIRELTAAEIKEIQGEQVESLSDVTRASIVELDNDEGIAVIEDNDNGTEGSQFQP